MKKNSEYSYYRTEGLKNILSSIEDISTEYYKRIDFFKTIKTKHRLHKTLFHQ